MRLLLTGGKQRRNARAGGEWHAFQQAIALEIDTTTRAARTVLEYVTPSDACPREDPSIVFKCGSLVNDHAYLCTQTEILVCRLPDYKILTRVSLPHFNDLHHVAWREDTRTFLVANTGLDMVMEITEDGRLGECWNTLGGDPWERFSPSVDYRTLATTKPHASHPNHVFMRGREVWVTRFVQRDAVSLTNGARRILIDAGGPHDGVCHGGSIYFTTTNGKIVEVDNGTSRVTRTVDLNRLASTPAPLGWCRGIACDGYTAWVGFSRLRPTRAQKNVDWARSTASRARSGFRSRRWYGELPTRIACYDLERLEQVDEIELEQHDLNAIFSVLPMTDVSGVATGVGVRE